MSLHDRIKEARKSKGLTQTELGTLIGVAKTTIAGYERQYEPSAAQLGAIADALDVDVTFLLQDEIKKRHDLQATIYEMEHVVKKYRSLDPYGKEAVDGVLDVEWRRCTAPAPAEPEPEAVYFIVPMFLTAMSAGTGQPAGNDNPEDLQLTKRPPRGTSYVAHISGDSMEPTYHDGDKLFIRACEEIEVGQIGVFLMDGQQWVKERGDGVLLSHNLAYPPIPMREDIRCQGLVLGVCDDSYFE